VRCSPQQDQRDFPRESEAFSSRRRLPSPRTTHIHVCLHLLARERTEKPSSTSSRRSNEAEDAPLSRAPLHVHYVLRHVSQHTQDSFMFATITRVKRSAVDAKGLPVTRRQLRRLRESHSRRTLYASTRKRASARVTLVKLAQLFLNVHVDTTKKKFHSPRASLLTGTQSESALALGRCSSFARVMR
jgi:hypothetical protein